MRCAGRTISLKKIWFSCEDFGEGHFDVYEYSATHKEDRKLKMKPIVRLERYINLKNRLQVNSLKNTTSSKMHTDKK